MLEAQPTRVERSMLVRVVVGVLWFIPIQLSIRMTTGAILGGMAGRDVQTFDSGFSAGQAAAGAFFAEYGSLLLLVEVAITAGLSIGGVLPGTGKWKKV